MVPDVFSLPGVVPVTATIGGFGQGPLLTGRERGERHQVQIVGLSAQISHRLGPPGPLIVNLYSPLFGCCLLPEPGLDVWFLGRTPEEPRAPFPFSRNLGGHAQIDWVCRSFPLVPVGFTFTLALHVAFLPPGREALEAFWRGEYRD